MRKKNPKIKQSMFNLFKKKESATPPASPIKSTPATPAAAPGTPKRDNTKVQLGSDLDGERKLNAAIEANRWEDVYELSQHATAKTLAGAVGVAAAKGKLMSLYILLERGAPLDHPTMNPLYYAVAGGCHDALRFLLERKAPLAHAHAAVLKAIEELRKDMLLSLVQAGAVLQGRPAREARTCLHAAAARGNTCHGILVYLLSTGAKADLDALDGDSGASPLLLACKSAKAAHHCVRTLIAAGANVNLAEAKTARSPLFWAAATGKLDAVDALLAAGADVAAAPLLPQIAAHVLHGAKKPLFDRAVADAVVALVAAGASATAKDADGLTAARRFAELVPPLPKEEGAEPLRAPDGTERLFGVLLAAGADKAELADALDRLGVDAVDLAVEGKAAIADKRAAIVRAKALDICVALRPVQLPAPALQTIVEFACDVASDKAKQQVAALAAQFGAPTPDAPVAPRRRPAPETVDEPRPEPAAAKDDNHNDDDDPDAPIERNGKAHEEQKEDVEEEEEEEEKEEPKKRVETETETETEEEEDDEEEDGEEEDEEEEEEKYKPKKTVANGDDDDDSGSYSSDEFDYENE